MRKPFRFQYAMTGISILVFLSAVYPAMAESDTQWMAVFLNGEKCGRVKNIRSVKNGVVTESGSLLLEIQRAGQMLTIQTRVETRETVQGGPIGFTMDQKGFGGHTATEGVLTPGGRLSIQTRLSSGETAETFLNWPESAVMNEGARLKALQKGLDQGVEYDFLQFFPDMMKFANVTVRVGETGFVDLLGRVVELTHIYHQMAFSGTVLQSESWVDERFFVQKTITKMMGMKLEMTACGEKYAMSRNNPSNFFDSMLIAVESCPDDFNPKNAGAPVKFVMSVKEANGGMQIPVTVEQTVKPLNDGDVEILVNGSASPPAGIPIRCENAGPVARKFIEQTRWLQHSHAALQTLARKARENAKDAREAADRMEKFVHAYIRKKNLSVGYATALEAAESREGDCTEHALLLAALFRASGIPSRVVSGLAYAQSFMGRRHVMIPHAWTQALIGNRWFSFDAALNGFDGGHIALAFGDGDPVHFFSLVNVIGGVRVLSAEIPESPQ